MDHFDEEAGVFPVRRVDHYRGALFCATLVSCAVAYSLHLMSFLDAKEAVLCVGLCAMAGTLVCRGRFPDAGFRAFSPLWLMVALGALVHCVALPCRVPSDAVTETVRNVTYLLAAAMCYDLLADARWRRRILDALIWSAVAVAALGLAQYAGLASRWFPVFPGYDQRMYSVFGNQDLLGGYLAMALPLLVGRLSLRGRWTPIWLGGLLCLSLGLTLSASRSAWLAALAGLACVVPMTRWRSVRKWAGLAVIGTAIGGAILVAPQATVQRVANSFQRGDHGVQLRRWFWAGTVRMIRDHPVFGVGPGNYAYWSPKYLGDALHAATSKPYEHNELPVDQPHSEPLAILAAYGVVGAMCAAWMLLRLARRRGVEWGGLMALLVFALFNGVSHSPPHVLAGLVLAGALLHTRPVLSRERPAWWLAAVAGACAMFFFGAVFIPSWWLRTAEDEHLAGRPPLEAYERCTAYPWPNAAAQVNYGLALLEAGRASDARRAFMTGLAGTDTGEVYLALGAVAAQTGRARQAKHWLEQCLWRWPSDHDAWLLLARVTPKEKRRQVYQRAAAWLSPAELERVKAQSTGADPRR